MDASVIRGIALDIINGAVCVVRGPVELFSLEAAKDPPPPPPQKPRERTVLQMRREREGKFVTPQNDEPAERIRVNPLKCYGFCAAVNIGLALITSCIIQPIFEFILSPIIGTDYVHYLNSFIMLPFFILTRIINVFCFADIAGACYRKTSRPPPPSIGSLSVTIADFIGSIMVEVVFLGQIALAGAVPFIFADALVFVHSSLLNALYSFEYFWMKSGVPLRRRIDIIHKRWPFFLGFGAPLTILTNWYPSLLVQGCVFGALFPLFIIASYSADWTSNRLGSIASDIPAFRIFYPSMRATDKISVYIRKRVLGQ